MCTEGILYSQGWNSFCEIQPKEEAYYVHTSNKNTGLYGIVGNNYHLLQASIDYQGKYGLLSGTTEIEDNAFRNSTLLTGVSGGRSLVKLGAYAFAGCTSLQGVDINNSNMSNPMILGEGAFMNCSSLTTLAGPNATSSALSIPAAASEIGDKCFQGCSSISMIYCRYNNLTKIGAYAFAGCSNVQQVRFGTQVKELGEGCFQDCTSLSVLISYSPVDGRTYYSVPYLVTAIPKNCFRGCTSLSFVRFDDAAATSIGDYAFADCTSMEYVVCSTAITSLGQGCFMNCTGMIEIASYRPGDTEHLYDALPYYLSEVPESCFEACAQLDLVDIPEAVTSIGNRAFYGCTSLRTSGTIQDLYEIPDTVTSIGVSSFENCTSLVHVEVLGELHALGDRAFANDTSLLIASFAKTPQNAGDWTNIEAILNQYFPGCSLQSLLVQEMDMLPQEKFQIQLPQEEP